MDPEKYFLALFVGVLLFTSWLMVKPFLAYILFALILAFMLHPLQKKFAPKIGPRVSASILIIFALAAAVVPFGVAMGAVIQDTQDFSQDVNRSELINTTEIEQIILESTGQDVDIETAVDNAVSEFTDTTFGSFSQFVNLLTSLTIGITLMLFLLYYFLKDGEEMSAWVKDVIPMPENIKDNLYQKIDITTWAVIKSHVLVAVIQGLVAGIGLIVLGVPNSIFWTFVMVLLGFIPLIGTILVWGPAAFYLFLIDRPIAAALLAVYGLVVVGITDNIVRPLAVDRSAELHPAVIIIGVIGGVYLFGAAGLFFGPILLGVLRAVLLVVKNNYHETG